MKGNKSVLVVEPNDSIRKVVCLVAGKMFSRVNSTGSAKEARKLLKEGVDVVITELELPDGTGRQVLAWALEANEVGVVLALTAEDDVAQAMDMIRYGAFSVLTKPLTRKAMKEMLERALTQQAVLEQNRAARKLEERYARELEERVDEQTALIESLIAFSNELNALTATEEAVELILSTVQQTLHSAKISILLQAPETGQFAVVDSYGLESSASVPPLEPEASRIIERLVKSGEILFVDKRRAWPIPGEKEWSTPYICVPLVADEGGSREVFGAISLTDRNRGNKLTERELKIVRSIADAASIACVNLRSKQQLEKSYFDTVAALAMALEAKDRYTHGHSQRVTSMCMIVADVMGFTNEQMDQIMFAAMLHDVGKIGIPDSILTKEDRLSRSEYDQIRQHPIVGERMVKHISFLAGAALIIRHHHERWDGKGYPDGLRGDEIELPARIMAIADSYDAMTTDRSYRRPLNPHQVRDELWKGRGTQFDPECLDIFLEHVAQSRNIPNIG